MVSEHQQLSSAHNNLVSEHQASGSAHTDLVSEHRELGSAHGALVSEHQELQARLTATDAEAQKWKAEAGKQAQQVRGSPKKVLQQQTGVALGGLDRQKDGVYTMQGFA